MDERKCLNCGNSIGDYKYCPNCGQSTGTSRLTTGNLGLTILSGLSRINSGFIYTCGKLFTSPWRVVRDYIHGKRVRYISPVQMFLILVFVILALKSFKTGFSIDRQPASNVPPTEYKFENTDETSADSRLDIFSDSFKLMGGDSFASSLVNKLFNNIFDYRSPMLLFFFLMLPLVPAMWIVHRIAGIRKYNMAEYTIGAFYMLDFMLAVFVLVSISDIFIPLKTDILLYILYSVAIFIGCTGFYKSMNSLGKKTIKKLVCLIILILTSFILYGLCLLVLSFVYVLSRQ